MSSTLVLDVTGFQDILIELIYNANLSSVIYQLAMNAQMISDHN